MKLNDRNISAAKLENGDADYIFFDDDIPGFGLRVRASGSRTWVFQYSRNGRARKMTLGKYPGISASEARELVKPLYHQVQLGRDPASEKQAAQIDHDSFGDVVAAYLQAKKSDLRDRTYGETERYLMDSARSFHSRPLANISRADIADLLNKAERDSGKATANRLRSNLSSLFTWAQQQGKADANPVMLTEKRAEQSRDRRLTGEELAAIWNALPDGDYGRIVKLLMLTGQRREEIGGLRWSEIPEGDTIHLPENRTKNGMAHFVPLSAPARAILGQRQDRDHVFGRGDGAAGFAGWSAAKRNLDQRLPGMKPWHLHDLRHAAVTGMVELGTLPHIAELVVNHQSGHRGGIGGIYNHATNGKERREALDQWAAHLMTLLKPKPKLVAKAGATASPRQHKAAA